MSIWGRKKKLRVFINYRKEDTDYPEFLERYETSKEAREITNFLQSHLKEEGEIFLDKDSIRLGDDWRKSIKKYHHRSSVVLCLIGKKWESSGKGGVNRLYEPTDVLREELVDAFKLGVPVIPILVNRPKEPKEEDLPSQLIDLGFNFKQALRVDLHTGNFIEWTKKLSDDIQSVVDEKLRYEKWEAFKDAICWTAFPVAITIASLCIGMHPDVHSPFLTTPLVFVTAVLAMPALGAWPSLKLIHKVRCREPDFGWIAAYQELLQCYLHSWGSLTVKRVARVRVEAAVVFPHPREPVLTRDKLRDPTTKGEYTKACFKREKQMREASTNALAMTGSKGSQGVAPELDIETCFEVHNATQDLQRYLGMFPKDSPIAGNAQSGSAQKSPFLCKIKIKQGFLSPQFLTTGLMEAFDENWKPVLDWYGFAVTQVSPPQVSAQLQRVQIFEFLCWLTWGPSIPICRCSRWKCPRGGDSGDFFMQFGYGDENNSFLICDDDETTIPVSKFIQNELEAAPGAWAIQCVAIIRPVLISEVAHALCDAQADAKDESRIVLLASDIKRFEGSKDDTSRRVFQAYVWTMFVICDRDGNPLFPHEPWRGLLPFFTHGNIAEPDTYLFIRREVVRKSLDAIKDLLCQSPEVTFRFACSSDESNCGQPLAFTPPQPTMLELLHGELCKRLSDSERTHVLLPDKSRSDLDHFVGKYSACHIPERLSEFYDELRHRKGIASSDAASLNAV